MKKVLLLSFLFLLLFDVEKIHGQQAISLSTEYETSQIIKPSADLDFRQFLLEPEANYELPFDGTLRTYYNQNYYFNFNMPPEQNVDVYLKYPDNYAVMITDEHGCTNADDVELVINPDHESDAGNGDLVCNHDMGWQDQWRKLRLYRCVLLYY
ncbi:MAG: hypothetical protein R6V32_09230 [Bacteroidales bacterium]